MRLSVFICVLAWCVDVGCVGGGCVLVVCVCGVPLAILTIALDFSLKDIKESP